MDLPTDLPSVGGLPPKITGTKRDGPRTISENDGRLSLTSNDSLKAFEFNEDDPKERVMPSVADLKKAEAKVKSKNKKPRKIVAPKKPKNNKAKNTTKNTARVVEKDFD